MAPIFIQTNLANSYTIPGTIFLDRSYTWVDILHEMIHYCLFLYGLPNYEDTAYACERACTSVVAYTGMKDVDPCCCSVNPPPHCGAWYEKLGNEIGKGIVRSYFSIL
jgi:hypothetical protein